MEASVPEGIYAATAKRIAKDLDVLPDEYKMLILDEWTARIVQTAVKRFPPEMKVMEDFLMRNRPPLSFDAVYFVSPSPESAVKIVEDAKKDLYPKAHIIFSSRVLQAAQIQGTFRACPTLRERIGTLREFNLEYLIVDNRTVSTFQPDAFIHAFSGDPGQFDIPQTASRLSTIFATLTAWPNIRYQRGSRGNLCHEVATAVAQALSELRNKGVKPELPTHENCDLLVLDRSFDIAAPFMHPWSYGSMVYEYCGIDDEDQVDITGADYKNKPAPDDVTLDESDQLWVGARALHFMDAGGFMTQAFQDYSTKYNHLLKGTTEQKSRDFARFPEYEKATSKLKLHKEVIWEKKLVPRVSLNAVQSVRPIMDLELDIMTGKLDDKTFVSKVAALKNVDRPTKQRLLICWLAANPRQMTATARRDWQTRLGLADYDVNVACNIVKLGAALPGKELRYAALPVSGGALQQPEIVLERIIKAFYRNTLSVEEYPYLLGPPAQASSSAPAAAKVSRFKFKGNTEKKEEGKRRLVVFVIGGVCREEMRIAHQFSPLTSRDIILVSTAVSTAGEFLQQLEQLGLP